MEQSHSRHETYEEAHVEFVSTQNGATVSEILKILIAISMTPLLSSLILPWVVPPSFTYHAATDYSFYTYVRSIVEYPVVVILPLWIVTVLAGRDELEATDWNDIVCMVIFFACIGFMIVNYSITEPKWEGFQAYWNKIKDKPFASGSIDLREISKSISNENSNTKIKKSDEKFKQPFITNYRAIVLYVTVIAIIAVDFSIFPRRYAKTKTYGYSLMDIGTGSFIFCNGIVAPEAKGRKSNLRKSWMSSVPLFVLGFIRLISVKGIEYHEVVEEYGTHWNFFFTLAAVKLLSAFLFSFVEPANALKLSSFIAILYELILVKSGLQEEYILNSSVPRNGLLDANREGLFSIWGYLSIYFASIYVGKVMYSVKQQTIKGWSIYACQSGIHILMLWAIFQTSISFGNSACRRVANMSYILWILATNYTILWTLMLISLIQALAQHLGLLHGPLISYELNSLMEKEENKIKKLNEELKKKKKCYGKSVREAHVEEKLSLLEDKLKEFKKSGKASISSDVASLITDVEKDLERIAKQLQDEDNVEGKHTGEETSERNLIPMPDLTKSAVTLEAICYNGLGVFLLGNLLTGLINCLVHTIYVPEYLALCYLWAYVTCISVVSIALYSYEIQLKFW